MFDNQKRKLKRSAKFIGILSKYGFQDLLSRLNVKNERNNNEYDQVNPYVRVRLALEELGPTFVKLGQTFSDRDDLLPDEFIAQLRQLQDNVKEIDLNLTEILVEEFGAEVLKKFTFLPTTPIAAASIAQVYKAQLITNEWVIIKVKRPNIDQVINDDLLILKDLISLIDTYSDLAEQLSLKHALIAFKKSLIEELSLTNEKNNIKKFQQNFKDSIQTHIPKVYDELCSNQVLTMEFIVGDKITDVETLKAKKYDLEEISKNGYNLFMSQILEFGFFHADPHAGNLLVNAKQQLVFIDFGAVGKIPEQDKPLFEALILNFMAKKANKIVRILKKLSLYYNISDERKFEMDVHELFSYVHNSTLKEISVSHIMNKMKEVLSDNKLVMPNYFYLLFKGVALMDGVGRQVNPDLDVIKSLKPITEKLFWKKLSPKAIKDKSLDKVTDLYEDLEEIPNDLRNVLQNLSDGKLTTGIELKQIDLLIKLLKTSLLSLIIAILMSANVIAISIFWSNDKVVAAVAALILNIMLGLWLFFRVLRRN